MLLCALGENKYEIFLEMQRYNGMMFTKISTYKFEELIAGFTIH